MLTSLIREEGDEVTLPAPAHSDDHSNTSARLARE
jgi:hypothetical protein